MAFPSPVCSNLHFQYLTLVTNDALRKCSIMYIGKMTHKDDISSKGFQSHHALFITIVTMTSVYTRYLIAINEKDLASFFIRQ